MKTLRYLTFVIFLGCAIACTPLTPVRIVITPTPLESATFTPTIETTEQIGDLVTQVAQSQTVATTTVPPMIVTSTPEPSRTPIAGDGTFIGSILNPNYTITPPATNTPTLVATVDSTQPLPTDTPIVVTSPSLDPIEMGVHVYYNMGPDDFNNVLYLAQQARVGWIKFQADWSFLQPNNAGEQSEMFKLFVIQVQSAKNRGFRTMLSVAKAPLWARLTDQAEDGPPDNSQDLVAFLQQLIGEIKAENVDAIEIWNEPNLRREWHGAYPLSGAGYMQLFVPVHDALRQFAPNIHLITAGLAPTGNTDNTVDDRLFLQQMFDNGLGAYTDVSIGVHPYGWGNPPDAVCCDAVDGQSWDDNTHFFFIETLDAYRQTMVNNGFQGVQMWVTEFGWATWAGFPGDAPEGWMTYNTPELQAQYALRAFQMGQQRDDVGPMILWNLNFANQVLIEERNEVAAYSILAPNITGVGDPLIVRPLYDALKNRQ